jgi:tetratricopeptide (TPR) repeat protein
VDETLERLQAVLADRYLLERELGRGGMATVWLAQDLKHQRPVALKLLRPELGAVLGSERFLREIRLTATLQHPHILPLLDSGEAAGRYYYVMPYVEGETLRQRLTREGPLPLEDALRLTREVAEALDYAHGLGVIHRDIKPENLLLSRGHALVADFGIALAVTQAGGTRLTETGLSLGTPAYMSPEQALGEARLDGRTDQYSLACVLYEMLAGEPPYTGPTAQAVIAKRLSEPVPHLRTLREVPPHIDQVVNRALARSPADRFGSVGDFAQALRTEPGPGPIPGRTTRRRIVLTTLLVGFFGIAVAAYVAWPRGASAPESAANTVAVLPFRVVGADSSYGYLREGMIDLLSAKLTGEAGPRAADPRSVVRAWRRSPEAAENELSEKAGLQIAARVGADQALLGSIVGTPRHVVFSAKVLAVPGGATLASANVEGTPDSLPALVDRLTAQLLARGAGYGDQRLADLTSASLPALRAYLEGQSAYRHGHYREARDRFERALETDSAFTLAVLSLAATELWLGGSPRAGSAAWSGRHRLGPRDRALAIAFAGTRFPSPTPLAEDLDAWLRAVEAAPERVEAWFFAGDRYFHFGALLGLRNADDQAETYLRRAAELDSLAVAPLSHLVELAALKGDAAEAGRLAQRLFAIDSAADVSGFVRWRVAIAKNDSGALAGLRSRFDSLSTGSLFRIVQTSQELAIGLEDADRAARVLRRRAGSPAERIQTYEILASLALNRGRITEHSRLLEEIGALQPDGRDLRLRVSAALYGDGNLEEGERAAEALAASLEAPLSPESTTRSNQYRDMCLTELWRMSRGNRTTAERTRSRLRTPVAGIDTAGAALLGESCAVLLDAVLAANGPGPSARLAVQRLDSVLLSGIPLPGGNLVLARLHERQGDLAAALAAVRRRARWSVVPADYLGRYFREEGRLAAAAGDRQGAIDAYQRYLALRGPAEPPVAAQVERVRNELAALLAEPHP